MRVTFKNGPVCGLNLTGDRFWFPNIARFFWLYRGHIGIKAHTYQAFFPGISEFGVWGTRVRAWGLGFSAWGSVFKPIFAAPAARFWRPSASLKQELEDISEEALVRSLGFRV